MKTALILFGVWLSVVTGVPTSSRIIGGSVTTIDQYPFGAALLQSFNGFEPFTQACGSTIINNRAVLTAAHCFYNTNTPHSHQWRIRVGSSFASSGGVVHNVNRIINHPNYDSWTSDNDIAILHSATAFAFNNNVQVGSIAGANYNAGDNQAVWAIGWGITENGSPSEQLRHVQVWTVNQDICRERYGWLLTDNMLCSGWIDVGGRDQCTQDSGGPLIHNNVVIGVCSFGNGCADPYFPGVNARVSRYTSWILANA